MTDTKEEFNPDQFTGLAMYAYLSKPRPSNNPMFKDAYEVDLLLDTRGVSEAQKKGYKVRSGNKRYDEFITENGLAAKGYAGQYVSFKKDAIRKKYEDGNPVIKMDEKGRPVMVDGNVVFEQEPALPPRVRDSASQPIDNDDIPMIGNGSLLRVFTTPKNGGTRASMRGEWGAKLISVTILQLVEREAYVPQSPMPTKFADDDMDDEIPAFAKG